MLTVGDQCEPIDPDGYGSNAYLSSRYCDYKIPVQVIHRLLDEGELSRMRDASVLMSIGVLTKFYLNFFRT